MPSEGTPGFRRVRLRYERLPDRVHEFPSTLLDASTEVLVLAHRLYPKGPVLAGSDAVIHPGDLAVWFLLKGQAFDIARIYRPTGQFRGFYVDALEHVCWEDADTETLGPLVDLFLDIWIWPDLRFSILDESELEEAEERGWISAPQAKLARETIHDLVEQIEECVFPPTMVVGYDLPSTTIETLASG